MICRQTIIIYRHLFEILIQGEGRVHDFAVEAGEGYFTAGTHPSKLTGTYMKDPAGCLFLNIVIESDQGRIFTQKGNV